MPRLDPARCRGHAACAAGLPDRRDRGRRPPDGGWTLAPRPGALRRLRGLRRGLPDRRAVDLARATSWRSRRREDLIAAVAFAADGAPVEPAPAAPPVARPTRRPGPAARARGSPGSFRSSLQIRHLDAGSSNAEDWELNALLNPVYDLQRLGIDFVASPRHADMLVVTGAVTRNLHPALLAHLRGHARAEDRRRPRRPTPAPAGSSHDSYATAGGVDRCLPVDVYVPGDPPRPQAILHGLLLALDRRAQKVRREDRVVPATGPRADPAARERAAG